MKTQSWGWSRGSSSSRKGKGGRGGRSPFRSLQSSMKPNLFFFFEYNICTESSSCRGQGLVSSCAEWACLVAERGPSVWAQ